MPDNQLPACFDERANIGLRRVIERSQCIECALILVPGRVLKRVGLGISRKAVLDSGVLKQVLAGPVTVDKTGRMKVDTWIAPIVCECCPTSAVVTANGPVVVFRGRAEEPDAKPSEIHTDAATIRDIQIARLVSGRWTRPRVVHSDNWVINACPDNGPAVDAVGQDLVVAWWTRSGDRPKVQVAFSADAGTHFGEAVRVDRESGEGQVTVVWDPRAKWAVVGWLEDHQVWARIVSSDGQLGAPLALGSTPSHARLPRWVSGADGIFASWTSFEGDVRSVRFARIRKGSDRKMAPRTASDR